MLSPPRFCLDNAAMIAGLAHHRLARGEADTLELEASPSGNEPAHATAR
jgi:tRNA A37 threonylcarbamoyltransferase TsaD